MNHPSSFPLLKDAFMYTTDFSTNFYDRNMTSVVYMHLSTDLRGRHAKYKEFGSKEAGSPRGTASTELQAQSTEVVHFCFSESFQKWLNVHPVTDRLYRKYRGTSEASVRHEKVTASKFTAFHRVNTSKNKRHGQFDFVINFSFACQAKNSRSGPEYMQHNWHLSATSILQKSPLKWPTRRRYRQ